MSARIRPDWTNNANASRAEDADASSANWANDAVLRIQIAVEKKRLVGSAQFIPQLERIATNETYINMARERARHLIDIFKELAAK